MCVSGLWGAWEMGDSARESPGSRATIYPASRASHEREPHCRALIVSRSAGGRLQAPERSRARVTRMNDVNAP